MTQAKLDKIIHILLAEEEVLFHFNNHYIYIQERVEGGYEGDIYTSEEAFDNGEDPLDGGICESVSALTSIVYFLDISRDLEARSK
jgi:hypothetical protein